MNDRPHTTNKPVDPKEYDQSWISKTWGWDDAETFVKSAGENIRPRVLEALNIAQLEPGARVLDVGCGRGEVVLYCARNDIEAIGIDYSEPALQLAEQARQNSPPEAQKLSRFILGDVKDIDSSAGKFDRILLLDLVEHLHDWELVTMLEGLKTLLAPGGRIIIHTLPNRWLYEITYKKIIRFFAPWLKENPRSDKEMAIHINEMSITHLDQLMRYCGYDCTVRLKELITVQARWHSRSPLSDQRGKVYKWFANPLVALLYRVLAMTPLKLLIVNEIFCVAWNRGQDIDHRGQGNLTENLVCLLGRRWKPWNFESK